MVFLKTIRSTNLVQWNKCLKYFIHEKGTDYKRTFRTFSIPIISKRERRWDEAIHQAKELVAHGKTDETGISTITSTEVTQFVLQFLETDNPVLRSVKQLLYSTKIGYQKHGLFALLVAKSVGNSINSSYYEESLKHGGISPQQRKFANAINLARASFILHSNLLNLSESKDGKINKNLEKSNRVGVLLGDLLLAQASVIGASIKNTEVLSVLSKATIDNTEHAFVGESDINGNVFPCREHPSKLWEERIFLGHASSFASGCETMVYLGGHDADVRKKTYNFAKHFMFALMIDKEINAFRELSKYKIGTSFSLELCPVIMHLDQDLKLLEYILDNGKDDITNLDFEKIYLAIQNGDGEAKSFNLLKSHVTKALSFVHGFSKESKAKYLLQDMLEVLTMMN